MKNLRSSASSSCRPSKMVVAFGEKPAQNPHSLSPRLSRNGLSSVCAKTGALAQIRIRAMKKSFIKCPLKFYFPQRRKAAKPTVSLRFTLRLCVFAGEIFLQHHLCPVLLRVLHVVLPKHLEPGNLFIRQRALHLRRKSHDQRSRRDDRAWTHERSGCNQRQLADTHVVQQDRADSDQTPALDVATVQSNTMAHGHFVFEYCGMRAIPHVNNGVVLHVGAVAVANVMN